jgi:hypothetical protein
LTLPVGCSLIVVRCRFRLISSFVILLDWKQVGPSTDAEELAAMIIVHHLGVSQSERVVWLCEELTIPYTLRRYDRNPTTRLAPAEYKALHPMEIAPVITD